MTRSVPAILILAGLPFLGSGVGTLKYASTINSLYSEFMLWATKKIPEHELIDLDTGWGLLGLGLLLIGLGVVCYIFGGRRR